jgi:hypothetical protein
MHEKYSYNNTPRRNKEGNLSHEPRIKIDTSSISGSDKILHKGGPVKGVKIYKAKEIINYIS